MNKPEDSKQNFFGGEKDQKKQEEKKEEKKGDTITFSQTKAAPIKDLDKASIDNLMKRPIEEVINRWKKEMDKQSIQFYENGEKLKHFELIFNKNFENVYSF